jgi:ribonucleoside-diphosphate reductase alpha chain
MGAYVFSGEDMHRKKLPQDRSGLTHKFELLTRDKEVITGYITANTYEDGSLAEVFCRVDKEGSTAGGLMDGLTTILSIALQYGVPLQKICEKLQHMQFEPRGRVTAGDMDLHSATSLCDYLGRWLAKNFLPQEVPCAETTTG